MLCIHVKYSLPEVAHQMDIRATSFEHLILFLYSKICESKCFVNVLFRLRPLLSVTGGGGGDHLLFDTFQEFHYGK